MAKKKKRINVKKLKKDNRVLSVFFALLVLAGFVMGALAVKLQTYQVHPQNAVWGADKTVKVPADLAQYLLKQDDCKGYNGTNSPTGVGLWGVYQTYGDKFAKISYGCSTSLSLYIMTVKQQHGWTLIQPTEYFATSNDPGFPGNNFLPKCSVLQKYQISKKIEAFCIGNDGTAQNNTI